MFIQIFALSLVAVLGSANPEDAYNYDALNSRLLASVVPTHYDLYVNLESNVGHVLGVVTIDVDINSRSDERRTCKGKSGPGSFLRKMVCGSSQFDLTNGRAMKEVAIHLASPVVLTGVEYKDLGIGGVSGRARSRSLDYRRLEKHQLLVVKMAKRLTPGSKGQFKLSFQRKIGEDLRGIYYSNYTDFEGRLHKYVVTQFQPTDARTVFPCFDEPQFKPTIKLSLAHSATQLALSTMDKLGEKTDYPKLGSRLTEFEPTPPMSIHMFSFIVGDFERIEARTTNGKTIVRAFAPTGKGQDANYALETAIKGIEWMETYTGVAYPLAKFDLVAVPDRDNDNTEYWGLSQIRDFLMLVDSETKPDTKITVAVNVLHVVAHQWFANLITVGWWTDLWSTESIAAQKAFDMVTEIYPEYQAEYFFRFSTLSAVLQLDSRGDMHPLSPYKLQAASEIQGIFDVLSFMKGASMAQLMSDIVGAENFKEALRRHLRDHQYKSASAESLLETLEAVSGVQVREILNPWLSLPSYPLINVETDGTTNAIALYQEPTPSAGLVRRSEETARLWSLPLKVLFSNGSNVGEVVDTTLLPSTEATVVECPQWFDISSPGHFVKVSPNPDLSTFYRVKYSNQLLHGLRPAIEKKQISPMDRVHILDDAASMAQTAKFEVESFKRLLGWHKDEDNDAVILEMLIATRILKSLQTSDSSLPASSLAFLALFAESRFRVTGNETFLEQRARMVTLKSLVDAGREEVIQEALQVFESGDVALFLREPVYAAVVKVGFKDHIERLFESLDTTRSLEEITRLASALALARDQKILNRLRGKMLELNLKPDVKLAIMKTMETTAGSLA